MHISKKLLRKKGIVYGALLSLCLLAGMSGGVRMAQAAEAGDSYTYTVRVFGGEHGTYAGKTVAVYPDQKAGSTFSVDLEQVGYYTTNDTLEPTYHYVGVHESGKDFKEDKGNGEYSRPSFTVNRDVDVVIAYGVDGTTANYTIRYVDRNGNELAASKNFSGSDNEVVVVPYRELSGYYPNAYNLRGTLSKDRTTTFSFVYTPIPQPTPVPTVAPTTPTTTTTTVIAPPAANTAETGTTDTGSTGTAETEGTTGAGTGAGTAENGTAGTPQNANPQGGTGEAGGSTTQENTEGPGNTAAANAQENQGPTLPNSPDEVPEIMDIEDVDVPLAGLPGNGNETATGINATGEGNTTEVAEASEEAEEATPASGLTKAEKAGIGVAIAAAIALVVALILFFKKRN